MALINSPQFIDRNTQKFVHDGIAYIRTRQDASSDWEEWKVVETETTDN